MNPYLKIDYQINKLVGVQFHFVTIKKLFYAVFIKKNTICICMHRPNLMPPMHLTS